MRHTALTQKQYHEAVGSRFRGFPNEIDQLNKTGQGFSGKVRKELLTVPRIPESVWPRKIKGSVNLSLLNRQIIVKTYEKETLRLSVSILEKKGLDHSDNLSAWGPLSLIPSREHLS